MAGIDPFDVVRRTTELVEKNLGDFLERRMRDPEAMRLMGHATSAGLEVRRRSLLALEHVYRAMDLPTRRDIESLSATLNAIESRLIDVEDALARVETSGDRRSAAPVVAEAPPARPPAAVRPITRARSRRRTAARR